MQCVVRTQDLLRELTLIQGIVDRKKTIPVLSNVLVATQGNTLQFVATDLDVALRSACPATVTTDGAVTLPAKKLYEIMRTLPNTDVRIQQQANGAVKITADRFDSRMQTLPTDDFPVVASANGAARATLPRQLLHDMIAKTEFAITGEDTRFFLNGAKFELRSDRLRLIATDGHRLALVDAAHAIQDVTTDIGVILPKKTLSELDQLLSDGEGNVQFEPGENQLFFEINGRSLISKVIDGTFPAYERVIPQQNHNDVTFQRTRLTDAVKRVALLSNERSRAVTFDVAPGKADITSSSAEVGDAREEMEVDYAGDPIRIAFNAQYVLDFLGVVSTDTVQLSLKDDVSQAILRPVGADGYAYTYVLMPMRL